MLGRQASIMARVQRLLGDAGYEVVPTLTDQAAMDALSTSIDAVIIGGGVEPSSRASLAAEAARRGVPVLAHSGGPNGLLEALGRLVPAP